MAAFLRFGRGAYRLAQLLRDRPHYIFGRFATVRRLHRVYRRFQGRTAKHPIALAAKNGRPVAYGKVRPSGLVKSCRSPREHAQQLMRQSYSDGLQLTPEAIDRLVEAARCRMLQPDYQGCLYMADILNDPGVRSKTALASVLDPVDVPEVRALAADDMLARTAAEALGYPPRKVSAWLFWSFANDLKEAERVARYQTVHFHFDVDGLSFVYANFYLLDTGPENGAHVLIRGTHERKRLRHMWGSARLTDAEARQSYDEAAQLTVTGPAGSGFFEDTSCFHKALPPVAGDRLMLQLRYQ